MILLAIDPGYQKSGLVVYDTRERAVVDHDIIDNDVLLARLDSSGDLWIDYGSMRRFGATTDDTTTLVLEQISMGGMIAGAEIFETCFFSGRAVERWSGPWTRMKRKDVKLELCGVVHAKDANIRAVLIEEFGPTTDLAIGSRKTPGPLYGIRAHEWAALALAVAWARRNPDRAERKELTHVQE
jgi:hypothetical protein